MKSRRLSMISGTVAAIMVVLVVALVFGGCAKPAPEQKTLKIGVVAFLGWPQGLDLVHGTEVMADMDNQNGGLEIGGERYKVELIVYDSNRNQATEVAAINRLVYEDKVKFIILDGSAFMGAWLPTTEENKVIVAGPCPDPKINLSPNLNYSFCPSFVSSITIGGVMQGWFVNNHPDWFKNYVRAWPDDQAGHMLSQLSEGAWKIFGVTPTDIFYPAGAVDLSAVGTKVKSLNPSAFTAGGGGTMGDGLVMKAVWQAGYRGHFFSIGLEPASVFAQIVPTEVLEEFIAGAWPSEFDPPLTQTAGDFKAAWIAKYGEWGDPEVTGTGSYSCLRAALQQAGTLDTDQVAAVIGNGLKYDSPVGAGQMVSRPDLGNNRTVDSICAMYLKQTKGGKATLLTTISIDEALGYFRTANPPK